MAAWNPAKEGVSHASRLLEFARSFFSCGSLSRHTRRTKPTEEGLLEVYKASVGTIVLWWSCQHWLVCLSIRLSYHFWGMKEKSECWGSGRSDVNNSLGSYCYEFHFNWDSWRFKWDLKNFKACWIVARYLVVITLHVFVGFTQGLAVFCGENSQGSESFETSESN